MGNIFRCYSRTSSLSSLDQHVSPSRHYYHNDTYTYTSRIPTDRTSIYNTAVPLCSNPCGDPVHWPDVTNYTGWHYWKAVDPRPPAAAGTGSAYPFSDTSGYASHRSSAPINHYDATSATSYRSCSSFWPSSSWKPSTASEPSSPTPDHPRPRRQPLLPRSHSSPPTGDTRICHTYQPSTSTRAP